ncbi:hypothetical protein [Terriglobus sp.]|uniref:hypothetical protein n=1 Tax=Terriglobus sp. TaxID=1889013 RepID=UPI003B009BDC
MPHKLAISESEDSIRVHAPAPQRPVRIVIFATLTAVAGRLASHLVWKFLSDTGNWGLVYVFLAIPGFLFAFTCLGALYSEVATTNLIFERNTIELERRLLRVRMSRRWFALADMRIFGPTLNTRHPSAPGYLYLRLSSGKSLVLLRAADPASIDRLCAALERRGWQYGSEPPED